MGWRDSDCKKLRRRMEMVYALTGVIVTQRYRSQNSSNCTTENGCIALYVTYTSINLILK